MSGPLPNPRKRRTNAPTIPTTDLPAGGWKGAAPKPPAWVTFGETAAAWWEWAWATPQAAAWSTGDLVVVARRAKFEDEDVTLGILKEMRELDDRLGLTPKGRAALRWRIVGEPEPTRAAGVPVLADYRAATNGA